MGKDKKCYVCQKDTLKKYICKDCYFKVVRENEKLEIKIHDMEHDIERSNNKSHDSVREAEKNIESIIKDW